MAYLARTLSLAGSRGWAAGGAMCDWLPRVVLNVWAFFSFSFLKPKLIFFFSPKRLFIAVACARGLLHNNMRPRVPQTLLVAAVDFDLLFSSKRATDLAHLFTVP